MRNLLNFAGSLKAAKNRSSQACKDVAARPCKEGIRKIGTLTIATPACCRPVTKSRILFLDDERSRERSQSLRCCLRRLLAGGGSCRPPRRRCKAYPPPLWPVIDRVRYCPADPRSPYRSPPNLLSCAVRMAACTMALRRAVAQNTQHACRQAAWEASAVGGSPDPPTHELLLARPVYLLQQQLAALRVAANAVSSTRVGMGSEPGH